MSRGRHQYYDPILQEPLPGDKPDLSRIELFPVGQESESRLQEHAVGKWVARRIGPDGRVLEESPGDFSHDAALAQAQEMWPGLPVYELINEMDDSTWEGVGPSPRMWQTSSPETGVAAPPAVPFLSGGPSSDGPASGAGDEPLTPAGELHLRVISVPGTYVLIEDVFALLEGYAAQYDDENNPSAAMGLREAAAALRAAF